MGFDCGFDMVPRLENTEKDNKRRSTFLDEVRALYEQDPVFQLRANFIEFEVGEHPLLPFEGHKFLRFSSKISSASTGAAETYIRQVCRLARKHFGSQIQFWHELNEDYVSAYDWNEVRKSIKSFYSSVSSGIICQCITVLLLISNMLEASNRGCRVIKQACTKSRCSQGKAVSGAG